MRERVGHGEVGRSGLGHGGGVSAGRWLGVWLSGEWPDDEEPAGEWPAERGRLAGSPDAGAGAGPARPRGWRVARRRGPGPRPVRPGVVAAVVRPLEVPRPSGPPMRSPVQWWARSTAPRVLARRPGPCAVRRVGRQRLRRAVAGLALLLAATSAVVALGLLARVAEPAGPSTPPESLSVVAPAAPVVVTVEPGETVWEVAERVAPGLSGSERAALAQRIVADNGLGSARPEPGRVLRVVAG
jgi:hypothetical protein